MASLDAQAALRKDRLAQLRNLKRKNEADEQSAPDSENGSVAAVVLSGRNYDVEARAPKLGFAYAPNEGQETVEVKAEKIVAEVEAQQAEEANDKPIDLFNLQPKKPNWDLKRDVEKRLERLKPRTKGAIAKLVRERINNAKSKGAAEGKETNSDDVANTAVEGRLAELVKNREREKDMEGEDDDSD